MKKKEKITARRNAAVAKVQCFARVMQGPPIALIRDPDEQATTAKEICHER
jgi:hypothetical protein